MVMIFLFCWLLLVADSAITLSQRKDMESSIDRSIDGKHDTEILPTLENAFLLSQNFVLKAQTGEHTHMHSFKKKWI